MRAEAVLGVDAGGSKSEGVLVSASGRVLGRAWSGQANYQACGLHEAEAHLRAVVAPLVEAARAADVRIVASGWGLAGLDRPRDERVLAPLIAALDPAPEACRVVVNDTYLILRAGTVHGTGVGVVSGTGSNCVAVGPDGARLRIGGLAHEFGDDGGGGDIGREGLRAAFRGEDGRGPATILSQLLRDAYELDRLDDLVDVTVADAGAAFTTAILTPLVFDAANLGDGPALAILDAAGRELALSARLLARRVFHPGEPFGLVLGGSVLQRGRCSVMRDTLIAEVAAEFPLVRPTTLTVAPVAGAALLALDASTQAPGRRGTVSPQVATVLLEELRQAEES